MIASGKVVAELSAGGFFGEQSLQSNRPASATVRAASFSELYRLRRQAFSELKANFVQTFKGFDQAVKLQAKMRKPGGRAPPAWAMRNSVVRMSNSSCDTEPEATPCQGEASATSPSQMGAGASAPSAMTTTLELVQTGVSEWLVFPNSRIRAVWAGFLMACLLYEAWALPFKLVFVGDTLDRAACVFDALSDAALLADCLLRFRLAYVVDGRVIAHRHLITRRYLRGAFAPTLITALPFSLLLTCWPYTDARVLQAPRLVRLLRLLPWLMRRGDSVARQQPSDLDELLRMLRRSPFDLQYAPSRLLPLLAVYATLLHLCACCFWGVVMAVVPPNDDDGPPGWSEDREAALGAEIGGSEWLPSAAYLVYASMLRWYLRALYFATCNLTGLGKDMIPLREGPLILTLFCFIVGVLILAYLTSAIITVVMQGDEARVAFEAKKLPLLGFMERAGINSAVIGRAEAWLEHSWHAAGGMPLEEVVQQLPGPLAYALKSEIFLGAARSSKLLAPLTAVTSAAIGRRFSTAADVRVQSTAARKASEGADNVALVRELVHALSVDVHNPGEWVLRQGMLNDTLFVVSLGRAKVMLNDSSVESKGIHASRMLSQTLTTDMFVAELGVGECFGEVSAVYRSRCDASVLASAPLEVIAIPRPALMAVLHGAPAMLKAFLEIVHRRRIENNYYRFGWLSNSATPAVAVEAIKRWIRRARYSSIKKEQQRMSQAANSIASY